MLENSAASVAAVPVMPASFWGMQDIYQSDAPACVYDDVRTITCREALLTIHSSKHLLKIWDAVAITG